MNFKFDDIKKVKEIRIKSKLAKLIPTIKTEDNPNNDKGLLGKLQGIPLIIDDNMDEDYCRL